MDLSAALLPGILVFAVIAAITKATGDTLHSAVKVPLAFVLGIATVFAVAASDFGHSQKVSGIPIDKLNGASLVLVGIMVGAVAVGINVAKTVGLNIGQNQP